MNISTEATDDVVLALLWLTLHDDYRVWKGVDPHVLNRLYGRGFTGDPVNKAKSVVLTEKGLLQSEQLFRRYFVTEDSGNNNETSF